MSDTAFRPATRGNKPLDRSFLKRATHVVLVTLATGAITLSLVAESSAQRFGGRGFGMMNRPMIGGGMKMNALGNRRPGAVKMNAMGDRRPGRTRVTGDRTRYPGG